MQKKNILKNKIFKDILNLKNIYDSEKFKNDTFYTKLYLKIE